MSRRRHRKTRKELWIEKHFPEYIHNDRQPFITRGTGMVTSKIRTRETSPWEWAPNVADGVTINMQHCTVKRVPIQKAPYYKLESTQVSDEKFQRYCDTLNYFRNGGRSISGEEGLDPRLLHGAYRRWKDDFFWCDDGIYTPGREASFEFFLGGLWEHQHGNS